MYEKIVKKIMFGKILEVIIAVIVSVLIIIKFYSWNEPIVLIIGIVIFGALVSAFTVDAASARKKLISMNDEFKSVNGMTFREMINGSSQLDTYIFLSDSHIVSFKECVVFPLDDVKSITKFITNNEDEKTKYSLYFRFNDGSSYDVLFSHRKNLDEAYGTICGTLELPLGDDVIVGEK